MSQTPETIPRIAIIGAGALIATTIAAAALSKTYDVGRVQLADAEIAVSYPIRFESHVDGPLEVHVDGSSEPVYVVPAADRGFLGGVVRGLERSRMLAAIEGDPPFALVRRADGRLSLEDPASGGLAPLEVFGPTNTAAAAALYRAVARASS